MGPQQVAHRQKEAAKIFWPLKPHLWSSTFRILLIWPLLISYNCPPFPECPQELINNRWPSETQSYTVSYSGASSNGRTAGHFAWKSKGVPYQRSPQGYELSHTVIKFYDIWYLLDSKFQGDITNIVLHSKFTWEGKSVSSVFLAKFTYTLHIF